jgi:Spy/CpxP family protein refolding chaperone
MGTDAARRRLGADRRSDQRIHFTESIMKRTAKIAVGVGAALALGLSAALVSAQPYGPGAGPGWGPGHMGAMGYGGMGPRGYGDPAAAAESRLAAQKAELKITDKQEAAWQAYAAQVKKGAESMQATRTAIQSSTANTAPERLALHNELMKQRVAQSEATTAALKNLYAVLTPEQRAILDRGPIAAGPGPRGPGGRYR